eukprot:s502_g7.t1
MTKERQTPDHECYHLAMDAGIRDPGAPDDHTELLFNEMQMRGLMPTQDSYTKVIRSYILRDNEQLARRTFREATRKGLLTCWENRGLVLQLAAPLVSFAPEATVAAGSGIDWQMDQAVIQWFADQVPDPGEEDDAEYSTGHWSFWYVPAGCSGAFKAGSEARRQDHGTGDELYQHIVNMYRLGDPCTLMLLARQAHALYPLFFDLDIFGGQSDRFGEQSVHDAAPRLNGIVELKRRLDELCGFEDVNGSGRNDWHEIFDENALWHDPRPGRRTGFRLPFTDKAVGEDEDEYCMEGRPKLPLGRWQLRGEVEGDLQDLVVEPLPNLSDTEWVQLGDISYCAATEPSHLRKDTVDPEAPDRLSAGCGNIYPARRRHRSSQRARRAPESRKDDDARPHKAAWQDQGAK